MTDLVLQVGRTVAFLAGFASFFSPGVGVLFVAERFCWLSIAAQRPYDRLIY